MRTEVRQAAWGPAIRRPWHRDPSAARSSRALLACALARSPDGGEWKVRATAAEEKIAALETALALEREAKERAENDAGEIVLAGEAYAAEVVTLENELHHVRNLLEDERSISGAASPASARSRGSQEGEMMADVPWWAACLPAANQLNRPGFERRRRIANL